MFTFQRRFASIEVQMDHTPNPDCLKFTPMKDMSPLPLMADGVILDVSSKANSSKSPLAGRLFEIEGVGSVCIGDYWVTVTRKEDNEWEELSPLIMEAIENWQENGEEVTSEDFLENEDTEINEEFDSEVVQAIKELVRTRIRPWVQQDAGNVKYIGFEDGVVLLLMQGACSSCPSSGATLKGGIEKMMMHWIPEVLEVCLLIFTLLFFISNNHHNNLNRYALLKKTLLRNTCWRWKRRERSTK